MSEYTETIAGTAHVAYGRHADISAGRRWNCGHSPATPAFDLLAVGKRLALAELGGQPAGFGSNTTHRDEVVVRYGALSLADRCIAAGINLQQEVARHSFNQYASPRLILLLRAAHFYHRLRQAEEH